MNSNTQLLSLLLLLLIIITLTTTLSAAAQPPSPPQSLLNAADTLANSGYTAMSLTLQLIAPNLPLHTTTAAASTALTIFSPPDAAFSAAGQPTLAHLLLHFSPLSLSPASLLSLPFSSTIPSLSPSKHLIITTAAAGTEPTKKITINNVPISNSPIFDDGFVVVYAIDTFFDLNFTIATTNPTNPNPNSDLQCLKLEPLSRFRDASGVLKSRGYSIMASFLDLQLMGFLDPTENDAVKWTLFAPSDEELVGISGDFLGYSVLLMKHMVPCRVGWSDLDEMVNGTVVSNNVEGFSLEITRDEDDDVLMVNGVRIVFPDMYDSDWLVIHGIRGVVESMEVDNDDDDDDEDDESSSKKAEVSMAPDRGEF